MLLTLETHDLIKSNKVDIAEIAEFSDNENKSIIYVNYFIM